MDMGDPEWVYDPNDPGNSPAYRPPETTWIEGDHPTENPDGVTNSNVDYSPKTQEEKAVLLGVEMVDPVDIAPEEPYGAADDGEPLGERAAFEMLRRVHSPAELVPEKDRINASVRNLRAGGSIELDELRKLRNAL